MARPIEATPILENADAFRVIKEAEGKVRLSPTKKKELDHCAELYLKFVSRAKSAFAR